MIRNFGKSSGRTSFEEPLIDKSAFFVEDESHELSDLGMSNHQRASSDAEQPIPYTSWTPNQPLMIPSEMDQGESQTKAECDRTPEKPSIVRLWTSEVLNLAGAATLMIGILSILLYADGRPTTDLMWLAPLNINSVLAVLSTVYRALLVGVSFEIISQFKWIWFWSKRSPARSLHHINALDDASRGTLGAMKLIPLVALRDLACLPPLIIIIFSFAIGPFVQQRVGIARRIDIVPPETAAWIPISRRVEAPGDGDVDVDISGKAHFKASIRGMIYSALGHPQSNEGRIEATCDTGQCIFVPRFQRDRKEATHASVGICGGCHDLTHLVTELSDSSFQLPNGLSVIGAGDPNVFIVKTDNDTSWATNGTGTQVPQYWTAMTNFTFMSRTMGTNSNHTTGQLAESISPHVFAGTCSLWPCLQYFGADVFNDTLREDALHQTPMYPDAISYSEREKNISLGGPVDALPVSWDLTAVQTPCRVNNALYGYEDIETTTVFGRMSQLASDSEVRILSPSSAPEHPIEAVPKPCVFSMAAAFGSTLASFLNDEVFNGSCRRESSRSGTSVLDCGGKWWLELLWESGRSSKESIDKRITDFAAWITTEFRSSLSGLGSGELYRFHGRGLEEVTYITVRWRWLLFPSSMLMAELIILGWAIARTHKNRNREMVWKSNPLPLIYYANYFITSDGQSLGHEKIPPIMKSNEGRLMTADDMEQSAKRISVKLLRGGSQDSALKDMALWIPKFNQRYSHISDEPELETGRSREATG